MWQSDSSSTHLSNSLSQLIQLPQHFHTLYPHTASFLTRASMSATSTFFSSEGSGRELARLSNKSPKSQQFRDYGKSLQTAIDNSHYDMGEATDAIRVSLMLSRSPNTTAQKRHSTKPYSRPSSVSDSNSKSFATRRTTNINHPQNSYASSSSSRDSLTPDSSSGTEDDSWSSLHHLAAIHVNLNSYPHDNITTPKAPSSSAYSNYSSSTTDVAFPALSPIETVASRIFHRLATSNVNSPSHSRNYPLQPTSPSDSSSSAYADSSSHTEAAPAVDQLAAITAEEENRDMVVDDVLGESGTSETVPEPEFDAGLDYADEDQVFAFYMNAEECEY